MPSVPIDGFTRIGPLSSLYRPAQNDQDASGPALVLLCTWMAALPQHISKYTAGYRLLYPNATILVCQSTPHSLTWGYDITVPLSIITSSLKQGSKAPVILHAFSNGGCTTAIQIAVRLAKAGTTPLFSKMVIDSAPARASLTAGVKAFSFAFPSNPVLRPLIKAYFYIVLSLWMYIHKILRIEDGMARVYRRTNDLTLFPSSIPRLYLYSKADELIPWRRVHAHADVAREDGYAVREEVFEKAPHCNLLKEDAQRYWEAVGRLVDETQPEEKLHDARK